MLSNNFLRKKKDGSQRVILNLKFLNETIDKYNLKFIQNIKILSVCFHGQMYEFLALLQVFLDSPCIFTKLLKPALSCHTVLAFIDDTLLQGDTEQDCQSAVMATCQVLDSLGFTGHPVKSILQLIQRIDFLGFWLGLINMIVSLTDRKVDKIRSVCAELLEMEVCSIRHMAKIIGYLVAAHLNGWVAPVFYIRIEIAKNAALSETVVILMLP